MRFNYVNFKAPSKRFKKDKETGDVQVVSRITFEATGVDDETLMQITLLSDSSNPVQVDILPGQIHLGPPA